MAYIFSVGQRLPYYDRLRSKGPGGVSRMLAGLSRPAWPAQMTYPKLYKRFPHLLACSLVSEESEMGKNLKKTNPNLVTLIQHLKDAGRTNEAPVWRDIALRLEGPASNWAEVNISRLDRHASENETVIIPGKLLGSGEIDKKLTVAAYRFSGQAREKIAKAGGQNLSIEELLVKNPTGSKVRIMG